MAVAGVMAAATVIERAVCYIVTGAGRIRPALCFEPLQELIVRLRADYR